jgi:glucokinase
MTTGDTHASTLGLDIGGSSIKLAFLVPGSEPNLQQSKPYRSPRAADFEAIVRDLAARASIAAAFNNAPPSAVGMCLPGVWNATTGSLERSNNLPHLVGVPLEALLSRAMGIPLPPWTISTDVYATAVDLWSEVAPTLPPNSDGRPRRLFCLALGTGVGGCVLDEGELLRINGNSSGHFGQIDVTLPGDSAPPVASDGGAGTLEAYWAASNVRHLLETQGSGGLPSVLLHSLARSLRIAHAIYRPDVIVLAGGSALFLAPHLATIASTTRQGLSAIARSHCEIRLAKHAHHAALGIARIAAQASTSVR